MKVAIFETEHFEAAYPLVRLFDNGHNEITLFTYPAARRQLDYMLADSRDRYQWITKKENQSRISFIRTIYNEVKEKKIELLYLNTISDSYIAYARLVRMLPDTRVIMTVHAINSFFTTKKKYLIRRWARDRGKKSLQEHVKEFNVLSQAMVPELKQKLPPGKIVHCIPGAVYEETKNTAPHCSLQNPVRIVVPGSIDGRRRDYMQVFDLLMLLQKEDIPVLITLAGSFYTDYGEKILAKCKQWQAPRQQLVYFEKARLDQIEFDKVVQEADLIFSPSTVNTEIDKDIPETYGLTISSGNISDVVRHAKPFIIPQSLVVDPYLEKSCLRYSHVKDIVDFLLLTHEDTWIYENLYNAAREASQEYIVEKIRGRNRNVF
jgi:hypothetical protein